MRALISGIVSFTATLLLVATSAADDLRYFRSDSGLGRGAASLLPDQFDDPAQVVWRVPLAPGHSTPCVYGNVIYLTTFEDGKLFTVALERATGKEIWKRQAPNTRLEPTHAVGGPAAATPACDGHRVYSFFGSYGLLTYDLSGELLWKKELGPFQDEFGAASSPILVDGKLILAEDHDADSFVMCLDAASGEMLWKTPREGLRSYSTPAIWMVGGRKIVVVAAALQLIAYDLDDGNPLWTIDGLARIVNTTPVADGNRLYVATWSPGADKEGRIAMEPWIDAAQKWDTNRDGKIARGETDNKDVLDRFFRIDINQDKGLDEAEWTKYARVFDVARNSVMALETDDARSAPSVVWQYDRGVPYVASPVVYGKVVYVVKDGGIVSTLDAQSGQLLKQGRVSGTGAYYASPVAGDGKVYLLSEQGVLTVLKAAGKWEVLHSHDFGERSVATPVIDGGQMFLRTEAALYCFAKKPQS
jgi:outer membrane protein assembly factor BamB